MTPTNTWGGNGLLGISIRFCSFENAGENVWHILDIQKNSPAEKAGLRANTDYIIAADSNLDSGDDFFSLIERNNGKPLHCYVYNAVDEKCREVVITPDTAWGGEGSLGCGIGYGLLHRLPKSGEWQQMQGVTVPAASNGQSHSHVEPPYPNSNNHGHAAASAVPPLPSTSFAARGGYAPPTHGHNHDSANVAVHNNQVKNSNALQYSQTNGHGAELQGFESVGFDAQPPSPTPASKAHVVEEKLSVGGEGVTMPGQHYIPPVRATMPNVSPLPVAAATATPGSTQSLVHSTPQATPVENYAEEVQRLQARLAEMQAQQEASAVQQVAVEPLTAPFVATAPQAAVTEAPPAAGAAGVAFTPSIAGEPVTAAPNIAVPIAPRTMAEPQVMGAPKSPANGGEFPSWDATDYPNMIPASQSPGAFMHGRT